MLLTAAAAGASGVILTKGCADPYGSKVIRASAGSLLRIACVQDADGFTAARFLKSFGINMAAAHLKGDVSPYRADMANAVCIMIGNEARGLSSELTALADTLIRIPMDAGVESLNAAAAGSILLYEAVRQRRRLP